MNASAGSNGAAQPDAAMDGAESGGKAATAADGRSRCTTTI
jgi:hypothetical protein